MLRITTQSSPEALTFRVEGKLVGEWAKELSQSFNQAEAIRGHRALIVDLTETLFIDQEGRRVLGSLFREGALFRTACPMIESIVSEIVEIALKQNPQVQIANQNTLVTQEKSLYAK
ncbi:MAG: STAS domain-containing protein [Bryobacteraceae bacterium]